MPSDISSSLHFYSLYIHKQLKPDIIKPLSFILCHPVRHERVASTLSLVFSTVARAIYLDALLIELIKDIPSSQQVSVLCLQNLIHSTVSTILFLAFMLPPTILYT